MRPAPPPPSDSTIAGPHARDEASTPAPDDAPFWRLFIALDLDDATRRELIALQQRWRTAGADVGWVRPEGLHVTLVFLGETPADRAPEIASRLDACAAAVPPFEFRVAGWGVFGRPDRPRVLWAGVEAPPELGELQRALADSLRTAGFPLESRPFVPHVTLGRVRSSRGLAALTSILHSTMNGEVWGRVAAGHVTLMRSRLEARGPVYSVVHQSALKGHIGHGEGSKTPG